MLLRAIDNRAALQIRAARFLAVDDYGSCLIRVSHAARETRK